MKKLLIIIVILSLITIIGMTMSDETSQTVNDLRWKHYGYGELICLDSTDYMSVTSSGFDYEWTSIYFKDGKLFVETQDGKWFIEMEYIYQKK